MKLASRKELPRQFTPSEARSLLRNRTERACQDVVHDVLLPVAHKILRSRSARAQDKVLRIELPSIDVRIPRIPRHDRRHPIAQMRRNHLRNDERFLPAKL